MKKFIVLSLVGLLILAFSGTAFSQEKAPTLEFKASGVLEVKSEYTLNVPQSPYMVTGNFFGPSVSSYLLPTAPGVAAPGNAFDKKRAYMESRGRLTFDAMMGKELKGTIGFEIDATRWGEVTSGYAGSSNDQRNNAGQWGADRGAVEVRHVFLTFGVPGAPVPVTVQAGIQPMAYRSHMLVYTDGPGIQAVAKIDPATIKLTWMKALENEDFASDDVDVYGVDASVKAGKMTIGGFGLTYNFNTYPIPTTIASPGVSTVNNQANMWWLGLYAEGKMGPVDLIYDLIFNTGQVEDHRDLSATARARDVKYRGWATAVQVDYPWEKFNFGLKALYASGSDTRKTDALGIPGNLTTSGVTSSRVGSYVVPPGSEHGITDMSVVFYSSGGAGCNTASTSYGRSSGSAVNPGQFGGTWTTKLYGSYKATPNYKITLQGLYIGDTVTHGNIVGTARKSPYGTSNLRDDKTIGWEFDLINDVSLYKNLRFLFGGGFLFAGDAMDFYVNSANPDVSPKDPWAIFTRLVYTF